MFNRFFFTDRNGRVRPDLRAVALRDWSRIPVLPGCIWRSVGPSGVTNPARTESGLVASIAVGAHPDDAAIGTRAGGVWLTANLRAAATTWRALGDRLASLQTVTVSMFEPPGLARQLMAGTGELGDEQLRNVGLVGVFRSVDGGDTWALADGGAAATIFRSHDVNRVRILDAERVLVATRVGLYFSKDGGRNFGNDPDHRNGLPMLRGPVTGLVVDGSSVAAIVGGEPIAAHAPRPPDLDWQIVAPAVEVGIWITTLAAAPAPGAHTLNRFPGAPTHRTRAVHPGIAVGKTVVAQRGSFWLMSAGELEIPRDTFADFQAIDATKPHHSIQVTRRNPATAGSWGLLDKNVVAPRQTDYSHVVGIQPGTAVAQFQAWFGTVQFFRGVSAGPTGSPWDWVGGGPVQQGTDSNANLGVVHHDQHAIEFIDVGAALPLIAIGCDGGLFVSADDAVTFMAKNDHATYMMWFGALSTTSVAGQGRLLCGTQDNGTVLGVGPLDVSAAWTWTKPGGGDGGINAWVGRTGAAPADDPSAALFGQNGFVFSTTLAAAPSTLDPDVLALTPPGFPFSEVLVIGRSPSGDWDRLFFSRSERRSGPSILRVRDGAPGGTGFRTIPPPSSPGPNGEFAAMITALATAPPDPHAAPPGPSTDLWVGLANGDVFFSSDAGATALIPKIIGGDDRPVTGIAIDPDDSRRVVIVYGGFSEAPPALPSKRVFITENRTTFRDISGARSGTDFVPDMPALFVSFVRSTPPQIVIGTDLGPMITPVPTGASAPTWKRLGVGLPTLPCYAVPVANSIHPTAAPAFAPGTPPIAVATFGRGAFVLVRPTSAEVFVEFDGGFGAVPVGRAIERTMRIHNVGPTSVTIDTFGAAAPFSFPASPAGVVIASGAVSAPIVVRCQAMSMGVVRDTLVVGTALPRVPVSCEAFTDGPARMGILPKIIDFGLLGSGSTRTATVEVTNGGQSDLTGTTITAAAGNAPDLTIAPAASIPTIVPGGSVTLTVTFTAGAAGVKRATWVLRSADDPVADPGHFTITASGRVP